MLRPSKGTRLGLTAAALLSLVVAGGLDAAPVSPLAADRVEFFDCTTQFAAFPVPKALLGVPSEFQTTPFPFAPTNDLGSVPVYVQRCASAVTDAGVVLEAPVQAWLAVWVAPPQAWRLGPGAAHYWVVDSVTGDARLAQLYTEWGLGPSVVGTIAMERVGLDNAWADRASVEGATLGLEMVNVNPPSPTPWGGLQARFFGRGADGAIHAADHREQGGFISQIQPAVAVALHDAEPLLPVGAGLGRTFTGPPGARTWTFTEVALPALT